MEDKHWVDRVVGYLFRGMQAAYRPERSVKDVVWGVACLLALMLGWVFGWSLIIGAVAGVVFAFRFSWWLGSLLIAAWLVSGLLTQRQRADTIEALKPFFSRDGVCMLCCLAALLVSPLLLPERAIVKAVYVEERVEAAREIYLAVLVDRSAGRVAFLGAAEGGVDIEETAARDPGALHRLIVDPLIGLEAGAARDFAAGLGLEGDGAAAAAETMAGLYRAFTELDASLIEINPLVLTGSGALLALDVKMSFDDNALFRHPRIAELRDTGEDDPGEVEAARYEINYVRLDGDIGCMVNGAGLALATIDLLKQHGGRPADFMDVRPVVTRQQVATGFKMILRNPKVKAILVNMYGGGILRCDTIAEGIAAAVKELGLKVPLVVRAAGTNMEIARKILTGQAIPAIFADDMGEAAARAAAAAKGQAGGGAS